MSEKVVEVTMGARKVGRIALDRDGRAMFEYDAVFEEIIRRTMHRL